MRYSHMEGTEPNTNAVDTHAGAPVLSDSAPAMAPPATPPTSNRIDSTPAACEAAKSVRRLTGNLSLVQGDSCKI